MGNTPSFEEKRIAADRAAEEREEAAKEEAAAREEAAREAAVRAAEEREEAAAREEEEAKDDIFARNKLRSDDTEIDQEKNLYKDEVQAKLAEQRAKLAETSKYENEFKAYNQEKNVDATEINLYNDAQVQLNTDAMKMAKEASENRLATEMIKQEKSAYDAEKVAMLLEISKEHAEKLLATDLAKNIITADRQLHKTKKELKLRTIQNTGLHEQLKHKRQENREMLHKISKQDDELAKVESELQKCITEQTKLKKELTPTHPPLQVGQVTRPEKALRFNVGSPYVMK